MNKKTKSALIIICILLVLVVLHISLRIIHDKKLRSKLASMNLNISEQSFENMIDDIKSVSIFNKTVHAGPVFDLIQNYPQAQSAPELIGNLDQGIPGKMTYTQVIVGYNAKEYSIRIDDSSLRDIYSFSVAGSNIYEVGGSIGPEIIIRWFFQIY